MRTFKKIIEERCLANQLPVERIAFVDWPAFDSTKISKGVIFVHALWSGSSVESLRFFVQTISEVQALPVQFLFLDADSYSIGEFIKAFGTQPHGNGEVIWIKDGKVVNVFKGFTSGEQKSSIIAQLKEF